MPFVEVTSYVVHWDVDDHRGNIQLNLANNQGWAIGGQTPEEMYMLVDLLRNEKPIYFDTLKRSLHLSFEPVGENE